MIMYVWANGGQTFGCCEPLRWRKEPVVPQLRTQWSLLLSQNKDPFDESMIGIRSGAGGSAGVGGVASIGNSPSKTISTVLCVGFGGAVACLGLLLGVVVGRGYFAVTALAAVTLLAILCCHVRQSCDDRARQLAYSASEQRRSSSRANNRAYSRVYNIPTPSEPVQTPIAVLHVPSLVTLQQGELQCPNPRVEQETEASDVILPTRLT